MRVSLVLIALLLVGCAQPSPLFPQPPGHGPVASQAAAPAAASKPRPAVAGEVRSVGEPREPACETCWSLTEILAAVAASGLLAWALARLYRAKAGKDGR